MPSEIWALVCPLEYSILNAKQKNLDSTIPMPVTISGTLALTRNIIGLVHSCYTSRMYLKVLESLTCAGKHSERARKTAVPNLPGREVLRG